MYHPVFSFSQRTTEIESRLHSSELEMLTIANSLNRFRIYLQGIPFKIVMDCNSVKLALNKKDINPKIMRWSLILQNFDYTFEHRGASRLCHAVSRSFNNVLIIE